MGVELLIANVGYGFSMVLTKKLKQLDTFQILYHLGIMGILGCGLIYCGSGQYKLTMEKLVLGCLLSGIPNVLSVLLMITALKMTRHSGVLTIVDFSKVVLGYMVSMLVYNEGQNPVCMVGVGLVVIGVSGTICAKKLD